MRNTYNALFCVFVAICVAAFSLVALSANESICELEHIVTCYITIESTDGAEHEFYYEGDSVCLVAHIEVTLNPDTETDLGGSYEISCFDITWQKSHDCENWQTIGTGEKLELVLDSETASSYFRFVAAWK